MANYETHIRTNYFRVIDEQKFKALMNGLVSEDSIDLWEEDIDDVKHFGFGSNCTIDYPDENGDSNIELFFQELASLLPKDDAFIMMEIGHEKLRYLFGGCWIVTNNHKEFISLEHVAIARASELLCKPNFETKMEY